MFDHDEQQLHIGKIISWQKENGYGTAVDILTREKFFVHNQRRRRVAIRKGEYFFTSEVVEPINGSAPFAGDQIVFCRASPLPVVNNRRIKKNDVASPWDLDPNETDAQPKALEPWEALAAPLRAEIERAAWRRMSRYRKVRP